MSYEYARIPLNQGLNLIVGPNGAGKSSILLAISVAFGQAYTERSRKLSDLIRRGKDIARVSLIFDNKAREGRRPIPYSKSDTFMLSRYLRKDGSYWYEADYKEIDKSEVVRLLREFGINPDNLLIIMHQGMIEELGAISQEQRLVDGRGGGGVPRVQGEDPLSGDRPQEHGQRGRLARPAHRQRKPDDRVLEADLRQVPREEEAPGAQGATREGAALGAGREALALPRTRSRRGSKAKRESLDRPQGPAEDGGHRVREHRTSRSARGRSSSASSTGR